MCLIELPICICYIILLHSISRYLLLLRHMYMQSSTSTANATYWYRYLALPVGKNPQNVPQNERSYVSTAKLLYSYFIVKFKFTETNKLFHIFNEPSIRVRGALLTCFWKKFNRIVLVERSCLLFYTWQVINIKKYNPRIHVAHMTKNPTTNCHSTVLSFCSIFKNWCYSYN